jgi:hypothetical protein
MEFFAGFEADGLAGGDGHFSTGTRVTAYPGFTRADIEHAKASQFNAVAFRESLFQAFKDGIYGSFCLVTGQTRSLDDVVDNILFYQRVHPRFARLDCGPSATWIVESFSRVVNVPNAP